MDTKGLPFVNFDALQDMVDDAESGWTGWDWAHDPGGIVTDGPGAVGNKDAWHDWEKERTEELEEDQDVEYPADVAEAEREYGETAQISAESAYLSAKEGLKEALKGEWGGAVSELKEASEIEREYGDDPTYGSILEAFEEAQEIAERVFYVALDASRDLWEAGLCNSDACVNAFEKEYESEADDLAERLGITIEVVAGPSNIGMSQDDDEGALWQEISNKMSWSDEDCEGCDEDDEDD